MRRRALHGFLALGLLIGATSVGGATPASAQEPESDSAHIIQQLQAENTLLRSDLQEMRVVMTQLKDMLAQMQMQRDFDQRAESQDRLQAQMDLLDAREREVDAFMQTLDPNSPEQIEALAALGYVLVEDAPRYLPYTVRAGDTVTKIAEMTGHRYIEGLMSLAQLNPDLFQIDGQGRVSESRQLQPGMTVLIPLQDASMPSSGNPDLMTGQLAGKTHTVKAGESIYSIAESHGLKRLELQKIFVKLNPELITLDSEDRVGSTRPLKVGDKLKIPYLVGIPPGSYFVNQDGSPTDPFASQPTNPGSVSILSNIPLVDALFSETGHPPTANPIVQTPAVQAHITMPPVNLAECMELSFRAIDLQGELELAKAAYAYSEQLAQQGLVGSLELRQAQISMRTLERKYGLSRSVLEARMNDLKQQIDELSSYYTKEHPNFPRREISLREQALNFIVDSF